MSYFAKFNISHPATGQLKCIEIDDEKKILPFFDKRMGSEMDGEVLGADFKGYIFRITGGNDKQGFPMKQGIFAASRVRLLLKKTCTTYRQRRTGERKRKSCRGCIVGPDLSVIQLAIVKKGEQDIPGITDEEKPRRLGPKRVSHLRKLFGLRKKDDVRKYVVRREIKKGDKTFYSAPKIQRLITEQRLRRKRITKKTKLDRFKASKENKAKYEKLLSNYLKEKKAVAKKTHEEANKKEVKPAKPVEEKKAAAPAKEAPKAAAKKAEVKPAKGPAKAAAPKEAPAPKAEAPKPAAPKEAAKKAPKKK